MDSDQRDAMRRTSQGSGKPREPIGPEQLYGGPCDGLQVRCPWSVHIGLMVSPYAAIYQRDTRGRLVYARTMRWPW